RCKEQNIEYVPFRYTNGDTRKQLLARAKHVLVKHFSKWTESQRIRAEIIFDHYPELKSVYDLAIELTNIYNNYYETILNYFVNRETNAFAESFNAKIKAFRAQFRGVGDIPFFMFRLCKLTA
ncbi:transposase, partial [uncultured Bacteroides sp.]